MTLDEIIEYMLSSVPEEYDISVGSFFYDLLYPCLLYTSPSPRDA